MTSQQFGRLRGVVEAGRAPRVAGQLSEQWAEGVAVRLVRAVLDGLRDHESLELAAVHPGDRLAEVTPGQARVHGAVGPGARRAYAGGVANACDLLVVDERDAVAMALVRVLAGHVEPQAVRSTDRLRDGADRVRVHAPERALDLAAGGRHGRGEWLRGGDCDVGGRGRLRPALAGAVLSEGLALALAPSHADVDDGVDGLVCVGVWLP